MHAKCYYNEKTMVICSMNLHTYSEEFNREMGVLISIEKDSNAYNDAKKEIKSIIGKAEFVKKRASSFPQTKTIKAEKPELGFCIRCEKGIKFDYYYPYCPECYKTWKKFLNQLCQHNNPSLNQNLESIFHLSSINHNGLQVFQNQDH